MTHIPEKWFSKNRCAAMSQREIITLYDQATQETIAQIAFPLADGFVIGRTDTNSDYLPDIDLARWQAREHGVSRRHAALVTYQDRLHLVDLASINGTWINDRRLRTETPHRLRIGDQMRFGTLKLLIG